MVCGYLPMSPVVLLLWCIAVMGWLHGTRVFLREQGVNTKPVYATWAFFFSFDLIQAPVLAISRRVALPAAYWLHLSIIPGMVMVVVHLRVNCPL